MWWKNIVHAHVYVMHIKTLSRITYILYLNTLFHIWKCHHTLCDSYGCCELEYSSFIIFLSFSPYFSCLFLYCRFLMKDLWLWWSHWLCCREWRESPLDWSFPLLSMTNSRPIRQLLESSTPTSSLAVHCLISQMLKNKLNRINFRCGLLLCYYLFLSYP